MTSIIYYHPDWAWASILNLYMKLCLSPLSLTVCFGNLLQIPHYNSIFCHKAPLHNSIFCHKTPLHNSIFCHKTPLYNSIFCHKTPLYNSIFCHKNKEVTVHWAHGNAVVNHTFVCFDGWYFNSPEASFLALLLVVIDVWRLTSIETQMCRL